MFGCCTALGSVTQDSHPFMLQNGDAKHFFFFLDAVLAFWPLMDRAGKTRLQISGEEIGCEFRK